MQYFTCWQKSAWIHIQIFAYTYTYVYVLFLFLSLLSSKTLMYINTWIYVYIITEAWRFYTKHKILNDIVQRPHESHGLSRRYIFVYDTADWQAVGIHPWRTPCREFLCPERLRHPTARYREVCEIRCWNNCSTLETDKRRRRLSNLRDIKRV